MSLESVTLRKQPETMTTSAALNQNIVNQEKTGQRKATDPWTAESKDDRFQDLTLDEVQTTFQEKVSIVFSVSSILF